MISDKKKYLWCTDTHLDKVATLTKAGFIRRISRENPAGLFLTGDISNGIMTCWDLKILASYINCPIYFVLGNHDYHFASSIENRNDDIRKLCSQEKNLIWMPDQDVIGLNDEVALIGVDGWYDAAIGDPKWLRYTVDWILIDSLRKLPNMSARVSAFKELSERSCELMEKKLNKALDLDYKQIYIMTHFPPWKEATRDVGTMMEAFWLPYNVNLRLGQTIERVMQDRHKRHVTVLAGHTHTDCWIYVTRNIECKVNDAKYYWRLRNEEMIFI